MADAVVVDTMVASAWLGVRRSDRQARWAPVLEPLAWVCDELDRGEKFWLMDWNNMIRDVIRALRTGEPVLYEDDD